MEQKIYVESLMTPEEWKTRYKTFPTSSVENYPKFFTVNDQKYEIYLGSDNHEYYGMYIATGAYHGYNRYFHYPDCEKCRRRDTL